MADNNRNNGYSDALGGYGVPSQVELTAGSAVEKKSGSFKVPSFNLNKKTLIIIGAAAAVVVVVLILVFALGSGQYASSIDSPINKVQTDWNGVTLTIYLPQLADDVDWAAIDEKKREGIASYAVDEVTKQAEKEGVTIFAVQGQNPKVTDTGGQSAFLYFPSEGKGKIQICVWDEKTSTSKITGVIDR